MEKSFHVTYQRKKGCRKKETVIKYYYCKKLKRRIAGISFCKHRRINNG